MMTIYHSKLTNMTQPVILLTGESMYFLREFLIKLGRTLWSMCRLTLLSVIFFLNGIHQILFNRSEVVNVTLHLIPDGNERETMSYINKLVKDNLDLGAGFPVPPPDSFNSSKFKEDDDYLDDDEFPEDEDDGDDDYPKNDEGGPNDK